MERDPILHDTIKHYNISSLLYHLACGLLCLFAGSAAYAQAPDTLWTRGYSDIAFTTVAELPGGEIILAGNSPGAAGIMKADANGDSLWYAILQNSVGLAEGRSLVRTGAGGFLLGGLYTDISGSPQDVFLAGSDANGSRLWLKSYAFSWYDFFGAVRQTDDSGFIVAGSTSNLVFSSQNHVPMAWLLKTDAAGDSLWMRFYAPADTLNGFTEVRDVLQTADGGYLMAGQAGSSGTSDIWIQRVNTDGDSLWSRRIGEPQSDDAAHAIALGSEGRFAVAGRLDGQGALIKFDAAGNEQWRSEFSNDLIAIDSAQGGGYIALSTLSVLYRTDPQGQQLWSRSFAALGSARALARTADGGYLVAGGNGRDGWIARLAGDPSAVEPPGGVATEFVLHQNYPNPFNPNTVIRYSLSVVGRVELAVYDVLGQKVRTLVSENKAAGSYEVQWDGRDDAGRRVASGVYYYRLQAGPYSRVRKSLLVK